MKTGFDQFSADLKRLSAQGVGLFNAMQNEQFPQKTAAHVTQVLKQDYTAFQKKLPSFAHEYQAWYSEALTFLRLLLPDRVADFARLYETPKTRKEVRPENYVIEDYLRNVTITAGFDKKVIVGPDAAIPMMQQQMQILDAVKITFESTLYDLQLHLQADLLDAELSAAAQLARNKQYRAAGILAGVVLGKHLSQLARIHQVRLKKNPGISETNEALKKAEVYDFHTWRYMEGLAEIVRLCYAAKGREPEKQDLDLLLDGIAKVIKMIF
ncbi:hypothetical protein SAMN05216464_10812 [Mucilaginibacter pineti]|uniref:Uncharacterized protein n=1 Tax=Mucilaginibacter pineti TaxID=1391627 RepID=A0A1G7EG56_9SPHI|nr:hypothetical protein [Mucilaginibacter pineti]SDE62639.1 hypothetical protein SAMN05216464_10812 [Mucilaginibacter pineti]